MIGAFRRGEVCGFQIGETFTIPSREYARKLAAKMYQALKSAGYAHIEPEPEFIDGTLCGIHRYQYLPEKG